MNYAKPVGQQEACFMSIFANVVLLVLKIHVQKSFSFFVLYKYQFIYSFNYHGISVTRYFKISGIETVLGETFMHFLRLF